MLRIDIFATIHHRYYSTANLDNFFAAEMKIGEVQVFTWAAVMSKEFYSLARFFDTLTGHLVTDVDECNYSQEVIAEILLLICMLEYCCNGFFFSFPLKKNIPLGFCMPSVNFSTIIKGM